MNCEISAAVFGNGAGEVTVLEIKDGQPLSVSPGWFFAGRMSFDHGQCSAECEGTAEAVNVMTSEAAAEKFGQLVVAKLKGRADFPKWRARLLALSEIMEN
jgi:hypothetical protein